MPLPAITSNMYFDTILKAIEAVLKAEAINQVDKGQTGWKTVRERFDPWNVTVDEFNPGTANVVWSSASFDDSQSTQYENVSLSDFNIDCYSSANALEVDGTITPKDERASDVLHTLVTKIYYTLMSRINIDLGLAAGTIVQPFVTSIVKFVPTESSVPIDGVTAARISCRIKHLEMPPDGAGVPLNEINVKSYRDDNVLYVEQAFRYFGLDYDGEWGAEYGTDWGDNYTSNWR